MVFAGKLRERAYGKEKIGRLAGSRKEEIFTYVSMLPHHMNNYSGATYILTPADNGTYSILAKKTGNFYSELIAPDGNVRIQRAFGSG